MNKESEQMNIVVVGHVDHGKSTLLGRLFADTDSLPDGKLEQIREYCRRNSKVFEYAFLLDALKDEQSQGITIDSARAFFKTDKRDYIIIDAPGHIEFLKNMISGAARAEAALLVIDAKEGIKENSRRHAYMLSMLGIEQVAVCVNKMDLVGHDKKLFEQIREEFTGFLEKIGIHPKEFIAISSHAGDNVASVSDKMDWFSGKTVLSILDAFTKERAPEDKALRMPVQGVYKFTGHGDERRIIAGRVEMGKVSVGDDVVFLPSNKHSKIESIAEFNTEDKDSSMAGESTGFTLTEQIFVNRGDMMCRDNGELPYVGSGFKANVFWMGKDSPLTKGKSYKLKIGTMSIEAWIDDIINVLDASDLSTSGKSVAERNDVAECIIRTKRPIAYDLYKDIKNTGRFVLVDDYEIAGGGIITEGIEDETFRQVIQREKTWERGEITYRQRCIRYSQIPKVILITGKTGIDKKATAKLVEKRLFDDGQVVYFMGIRNILRGLDSDIGGTERGEHIRRFAEVAHILVDSGQIVIATASDLDENNIMQLKTIIGQDSVFVIKIGEDNGDLILDDDNDAEENADRIISHMREKRTIFGVEDDR
ncbi:MAG: GTP-binding protein [Candidatus Woesearchaeota archaeon]